MTNNTVSVLVISKGKKSSRYLDINLNFLKYAVSLVFALVVFSVVSLYYSYTFYGNSVPKLSPQAITVNQPKPLKEDHILNDLLQPTVHNPTQNFEFENRTSIVDENLANKLIEVEKKLIDLQKQLKKKGIRKELSIGGEFIPADLFSDEYFEFIERDIESMTRTFRKYPIGKPTSGAITSGFGYRKDPFNKKVAFHSGIDLKKGYGSPVISTAEGVVEKAGWCQGYGKCIVINHYYGYKTLYGHLSKIKVKKGQWIESGQLIGRVGSTGRSTGPHLHYEVIKHDKKINPRKYLSLG